MPQPSLSRQQRRRLRRDLVERGGKLMARGIGREIAENDALGVALILHERLTDSSRPRRAAEAAEMAETLLQRSLAEDLRNVEVGCRKGCSYCCSALVTISAPEIFRVAHWLRQNAIAADAPLRLPDILAEAARRDGLELATRLNERRPCPMLVAGACGVYEVRPISCRAVYSLSAEACRVAMVDDRQELPLLVPTVSKGDMARTLLLAAVSAAGLPDRGIEYASGIKAAVETPDAEARWLAGEDVFAAALGAERKPAARITQDRLAGLIRELVG